ncbi:MAG: hypothetical protein KKC05_01570, partial [Nanoarchaeota archaeon]|nr:hypothetical protein [Nanoarchaeota archaeon]
AENGDQDPAYLFSVQSDNPFAPSHLDFKWGNPSYVNMADIDQAIKVMCRLGSTFDNHYEKVPYMVGAFKHGTPCGLAVSWDHPEEAIENAMLGDPVAGMGCELITNFSIPNQYSRLLRMIPERLRERVGRKNWGADVIVAPDFECNIEKLGKRPDPQRDRALMSNIALLNPRLHPTEWMIRPCEGGDFLLQRAPSFIFDVNNVEEAIIGEPLTEEQLDSLFIAQVCAWVGSSNAGVFARNRYLIGPGFGQQDRRTVFWLARKRAEFAGHNLKGSVFASDAFFFLPEGGEGELVEAPQLIDELGCVGGVVTADGKNLSLVKDFFRKTRKTVYCVHPQHRGFSRH